MSSCLPSKTKQTVYLCDPEAERAALIAEALRASERLAVVYDPAESLENLETCCRESDDVVVVMPLTAKDALDDEVSTDRTTRFIKGFGNKVPIVVYCSHSVSPQLHSQALLAGAKSVVQELSPEAVVAAVLRVIERHEQELQSQQLLISRLERLNIAGGSRVWLTVMAQVFKISHNREVPVLLTGRTGTGKELVALALHTFNQQSAQQPFRAVNCGAFVGELVRSELFGHRKGAFTGADKDHEGVFKRAQGGTLFLDEIQELDLRTQGMLLRAIQEQRICPIGSNEEIEIRNVRLVAATNQPIDDLVRTGHFREDLFFRLNVVRVNLPELSERPEDIVSLTHHFLKKHGHGCMINIDPIVMEAFQRAPWRGNARELENVIRATLLTKEESTVIRLEDLPLDFLRQLAELSEDDRCGGNLKTALEAVQLQDNFLLREFMEREEAHDLLDTWLASRALKATDGNRSRAAKLLGVTRGCLRSIVRENGIHVTPHVSMNGHEE